MDTVIEKLKSSLPQLEQEIKRIAGVEIKLSAELVSYSFGDFLEITSGDLSSQLCGISAPMFEKINFSTWGGIPCDDGMINFRPKVEYVHYSGGSNGTDYIWSGLAFNANTGQWDFENSRLIYRVVNE